MTEDFPYSAFNNIKEEPGCYCWYIDWTNIRLSDFEKNKVNRLNLLRAIFDVYAPNSIYVEASRKFYERTQHFGEKYEGPIGYIKHDKLPSMTEFLAEDFNLFKAFIYSTKSLIIPIYIGKSKNLKSRIKQHVEFINLKEAVGNLGIDNLEQEVLKNFSERFKNLKKKFSNLGLRQNMLSVKLIYMAEDKITEFESSLNHLYKPLFGIK
jgi:hypothetical protein